MSHALRHEPDLYGLTMDEEGWVSVEEMLQSFHDTGRWENLEIEDINQMQESSPKQRFEIKDGKIRALYGHSLPDKIKKQSEPPPQNLYHGTSKNSVQKILKFGLMKMDRQYVHLSTDEKTAYEVGRRHSRDPVMLKINALQASEEGINFYRGNESIWLADEIPPQFISIEN